MRNYWISTIWPFGSRDESRICHVFLKERRKTFPQVGDFVFFRESISTPKREIIRYDRSGKTPVRVKKGSGGIFALAIVRHPPVSIPPYPDWVVVHEYGNLREWRRVIQCTDHRVGEWMTWEALSRALEIKNGRCLSLYRLRDIALIDRLMDAVDK